MKNPYPTSIGEAALLLDKVCPIWFHNINLDILDMDSLTRCILGQMYGSYDKAIKQLFDETPYHCFEDKIFGSEAGILIWKKEIDKRKKQAGLNALPPTEDGWLSFMEVWPHLEAGNIIQGKNGLKYKLSCGIFCALDNATVSVSYDIVNQKYKVLPKKNMKRFSELKDRQKFVHDSYTYTALVPPHGEYNAIDRHAHLECIDEDELVEVLE